MKKLLIILLLTTTLMADKKDAGISAFAGAALYGGCIWVDKTFDIEYLDERVCYLFPVAYTVGMATVGDMGSSAAAALIVPTPVFVWKVIEW